MTMDIEHEELKVCTFSTHGLKGNILYINSLIEYYDIIFINEHWLTLRDKFILENLCKEKNLYFQSAECAPNRSARPYGGLAWKQARKSMY
jgi:hypothetical protein